MTPKGVEKTKPLTGSQEGEKSVIANRWKIATYVSIAVIIGLIILNLAGGTKQLHAGDIQSLVVLPFDNFTGDDQLEYFVSGMHASLIGDMGKIGGLRVISKTSSNIYKDIDMSVPEIASELGVDAIVEAQVMCLGDSICVQFKLISAFPEEELLWIGDYKEEKSQILNLYNRVTKKIADEVKVKLTLQEETLLTESKTVNTEAYDAYLKGKNNWDQLTEDGLQQALDYFNISLEKDPDFAPAYAGIAEVWVGRMQMGFASPSIAIPKIYQNLNKTLELDPNSANSHYVNALIVVWTEWNWEKGEREFLKVLEFNPNDALCRAYYAHLLMILQRPDEAYSQINMAMGLDPLNPLIQALYAGVLYYKGDYQPAILQAEKVLSVVPDHPVAWSYLTRAYYWMGDYQKYFDMQMQNSSLDNETIQAIQSSFKEKGHLYAIEKTAIALEELSQNSFVQPLVMAKIYARIKQYDKAFEWLEKVYEMHDPNLPYILIYKDFIPLKDDPRFIEIVRKMKLPL